MHEFDEARGLRFGYCRLGLSVRRIYEHLQLGQVNPFPSVTKRSAGDPSQYVDVVDVYDSPPSLVGLTLAELNRGVFPERLSQSCKALLAALEREPIAAWLNRLGGKLVVATLQRGMRNCPAPFVPVEADSDFGIAGLRCSLLEWLHARRGERKSARSWFLQLENLRNRGLRIDEFYCTNVLLLLDALEDEVLTGARLIDLIDLSMLRLSIRPVISTRCRQLDLAPVPADQPAPRSKSARLLHPNGRTVWRDRAIGYSIDLCETQDLFERERYWLAIGHTGKILTGPDVADGKCATESAAIDLANLHARFLIPRVSAVGLYSVHRLPGGHSYREWVVTLPCLDRSFQSDHFPHRNVLFHLRTDIREGVDGERVLMLQEVQSDWARWVKHRKAGKGHYRGEAVEPPWLAEWPSLALKLLLLHSAHLGVDALAWTRAFDHNQRWRGLGQKSNNMLYDRLLPKTADEIMKSLGGAYQVIEIYLPSNYAIDPSDTGYEIRNENGDVVARCATWEKAQAAIPACAMDRPKHVHGVRLDNEMRKAITERGFYSWGTGVRS